MEKYDFQFDKTKIFVDKTFDGKYRLKASAKSKRYYATIYLPPGIHVNSNLNLSDEWDNEL